MTSTCSASARAVACVLKIVWTVGMAITIRMRSGITVHAISSVVLPWTCSGRGLAGPLSELDQRVDENRFDEDEDERPEPDHQPEEEVDVPIDVGAMVKNRIGMILTAGGEQNRERDRQRGRTRGTGTQPAQAGEERACRVLLPAF